MKPNTDHPEDVLRFCKAHPDAALVAVTAVTGGTLRSPGAIMAVSTDEVLGYVSNGCVDADIVAHARSGYQGALVYGEGSVFRDIVLPCGGRIEVYIAQNPDVHQLNEAILGLNARSIVHLVMEDLSVRLKPRLRLRIAGRGAVCVALAALAEGSGLEVNVQSPDPDIYQGAIHLVDATSLPMSHDDDRTAVVLLFHDHDWEPSLLKQALTGPAFYVGAMGSEKTHAARLKALLDIGVSPIDAERIRGPIGLIPAQRDARFLALSILAEIIQSAQAENLL